MEKKIIAAIVALATLNKKQKTKIKWTDSRVGWFEGKRNQN